MCAWKFLLKQLCGQHLNENSLFCTREKRNAHVKICKKYLHPPRENKNPYLRKSFKVPVKNFHRTWKLAKKYAWNWFFVGVKSQKLAKKPFHAHFWFSRRKKTLITNGIDFMSLCSEPFDRGEGVPEYTVKNCSIPRWIIFERAPLKTRMY